MRRFAVLYALFLLINLAPLATQAGPAPQPEPIHDDALIAPPRSPGLNGAGDDQRGPSQYMAGRVAVRLVLPESDGRFEPASESWSAEEIAHVTEQARAALDWWEAQLPLARLSFSLRVDVAPTGYEPIKHGLADEGLWIGDALRNLGFDGPSYFDQAYAAGDANREASGSDWTTTIFLVDSSAHPTGYFADGRFAYAYINGPLMVVTSDAGSYGANHLAPVIAHELGHIFGALDQYAAARITCERRSGYLSIPTTNSQFGGCGTREPSIMLEPMGAYLAGQIDGSARAQVGYRDSDDDGLIDPLDTGPAIELAGERLAPGSGRPVISGSLRDTPYPAPFQQRVTLNTIAGAEYRVNGGHWLPLPAADGAFDEAAEAFEAELPLYDGTHAVEVRAVNSAGVASPVGARTLTITWLGPQPAYEAAAPDLAGDPTLPLTLAAPEGTSGVQVSEDPTFAGASWQPFSAALRHTLSPGDGARTLYVRFRDRAGLGSLPFALPVTLDTHPPDGSASRAPGDPSALLLSASDETSGVAAVELQVGDSTAAWQPYSSRVQLGAEAAGAPVTLRFRDGAGNVSAPYVAPSGYSVMLPLITR